MLIGLTHQLDKLVFDDFRTHCVNTVGEPFLAPVGQYVFAEIRKERSILPPGAKNGSPTVFLKRSQGRQTTILVIGLTQLPNKLVFFGQPQTTENLVILSGAKRSRRTFAPN